MWEKINRNNSAGPAAASFELDDEVLSNVYGGINQEELLPSDTEVEQLCSKAEALMMNPNISQADKTLLKSALTSLTDLMTNVKKNPPDIDKIISELEQKYPNL